MEFQREFHEKSASLGFRGQEVKIWGPGDPEEVRLGRLEPRVVAMIRIWVPSWLLLVNRSCVCMCVGREQVTGDLYRQPKQQTTSQSVKVVATNLSST